MKTKINVFNLKNFNNVNLFDQDKFINRILLSQFYNILITISACINIPIML